MGRRRENDKPSEVGFKGVGRFREEGCHAAVAWRGLKKECPEDGSKQDGVWASSQRGDEGERRSYIFGVRTGESGLP